MRLWIFITILNLLSILAQECLTPNGVRALCTLQDNCDPVYDFIASHKGLYLTPVQQQYLNLIMCFRDDYGRPHVCCAAEDPFFEQNIIKSIDIPLISRADEPSNTLPDPLKLECGRQVITNRIVGGSNAELGEFPWMALLEYQNPDTKSKSFSCGGTLIHRRYVLTAAHCTTGDILQLKGNLVNVRLGEHNLNTTWDCESEKDEQECSMAIDVGVEYAIPHPNYTQVKKAPYNDIALVRLVRDIETTNYIQPICFPNNDIQSSVGTGLIVAGWGKTKAGYPSEIKQKVIVPVVDFTQCQNTLPGQINHATQICAGAEPDKDACNGDSGGPLMVLVNRVYIIEGIVSFGPKPCGLDGVSGVYTRVNSYTDWILSTIM